MSIKLTPFSDFIIIEPVEEAKVTEMGLEIPDNAGKDKPRVGKVMEIGPDVTFVEKGDTIIYSPYSGETLFLQVDPVTNKELKCVREDALISLYTDTNEAA